ncbi:hypothetical protein HpCOL25_12990 [Helicobacter pylori]
MIVNDPETHASQATIIGKMVDSIKRYEEIISKTQAQVNQLQKVNNMINTTNSLISSSAITLANPMQVLPKTNALKPLAFSYGDTRRNAFRC